MEGCMSLIQLAKHALRRLTPTEKASSELAEAELSRLEAHTAMEYAASVVSYQDTRIKRLRKFLADQEKTV
jgi:hypothetical protein